MVVGLVDEEWNNFQEIACMGKHMAGYYGCSSLLGYYCWMKRNW